MVYTNSRAGTLDAVISSSPFLEVTLTIIQNILCNYTTALLDHVDYNEMRDVSRSLMRAFL